MKKSSIILTVAALLVASGGALRPLAAVAAADEAPASNRIYIADGFAATTDSGASDLEAKLAAARLRLEQAAHEVAELATQMGEPVLERFMLSGKGAPRAVIGVQLDTGSGKDGARIQEVSPGGPAAEAGLRAGDVIVAINDTDVKGEESARQVMHLIHDVPPESKVKVRVLREGKPSDFTVTTRPGMGFRTGGMIGARELPGPLALQAGPPGDLPFNLPMMIRGPLADMELVTLTPQLGRYFGTDKGVLVVRASREQGYKLEDGDVILAIDGRQPTSGSHATRILSSYLPGEKIAIKLMRQHKMVNVEATLPERSEPEHKVHLMRHDDAPT
jgi:predicted metalloprotease with PDZ domain